MALITGFKELTSCRGAMDGGVGADVVKVAPETPVIGTRMGDLPVEIAQDSTPLAPYVHVKFGSVPCASISTTPEYVVPEVVWLKAKVKVCTLLYWVKRNMKFESAQGKSSMPGGSAAGQFTEQVVLACPLLGSVNVNARLEFGELPGRPEGENVTTFGSWKGAMIRIVVELDIESVAGAARDVLGIDESCVDAIGIYIDTAKFIRLI
ncbi:MAG: hypothetical protein M1836_001557 [Candelina mexicana]|nr:MAG: hypothetical protein M1836_001557 [Candelina mexicana]